MAGTKPHLSNRYRTPFTTTLKDSSLEVGKSEMKESASSGTLARDHPSPVIFVIFANFIVLNLVKEFACLNLSWKEDK